MTYDDAINTIYAYLRWRVTFDMCTTVVHFCFLQGDIFELACAGALKQYSYWH